MDTVLPLKQTLEDTANRLLALKGTVGEAQAAAVIAGWVLAFGIQTFPQRDALRKLQTFANTTRKATAYMEAKTRMIMDLNDNDELEVFGRMSFRR